MWKKTVVVVLISAAAAAAMGKNIGHNNSIESIEMLYFRLFFLRS